MHICSICYVQMRSTWNTLGSISSICSICIISSMCITITNAVSGMRTFLEDFLAAHIVVVLVLVCKNLQPFIQRLFLVLTQIVADEIFKIGKLPLRAYLIQILRMCVLAVVQAAKCNMHNIRIAYHHIEDMHYILRIHNAY